MLEQYEAPEVEAISLDLWGTLIRSHPEFKPARTRMLGEAFGIDATQDPAADATFREADRRADDDAERLGTDVGFAPRVLAMHGAAVRVGLSTAPAPDAAALAALEARQGGHVEAFPPQPYGERVVPLLLALGDRLPLAVTSNTGMLGGATMRRALAANGLLPAFRVLVFSNEVDAAKPSPEIFRATHGALAALTPGHVDAEAAPLARAGVLHLGDNPVADVDGALRFGFAAQRVNVGDAPPIETVLRGLLARLEARA